MAKYDGIEDRWSFMMKYLHEHAGRLCKKTGDKRKAEEHYRLAQKYKKRLNVLELTNPRLPRLYTFDFLSDVIRKRPEYTDFNLLKLDWIPYTPDKKLCKCCGQLHEKLKMGILCDHIGNSSNGNYGYYNCPCGSTLVIKLLKEEIAA